MRTAWVFFVLLSCSRATEGPPRLSGAAAPSPVATSCQARGVLPDPTCTPGAVETTDLDIICRHSTRERRSVSAAVHRQAFAEYGLAFPPPRGEYEVDHLIPLELGGSNDIANLWPEPDFHGKDRCENWAHRAVCAGQILIEEAQRKMAADWRTLCPP